MTDLLNPFLLFPALAVVALIYYIVPARQRWIVLLAASYAFYYFLAGWAVLVLLAVTLLNYGLGFVLGSNPRGKNERGCFMGWNSTQPCIHSYFSNMLAEIPQLSATFTGKLLLPLGMSFFTLQNISYLVDVSRGLIPPERHFGRFAVFMAFFPKVASGPIERGKKLLPQLQSPGQFYKGDLVEGLRQIVFGLVKKLVIADHLAVLVNQVFGEVGTYNGFPVLLALLFLSFQIYLDFSGYSDIAIGTARLFGIRLTNNFDRPYLSADIVEFWNRWHLSFSTWLRDYLFFPLRRFFLKREENLHVLSLMLPPLLTMLFSGAWHGVGWTFLLWGVYHAIFYIASILWRQSDRGRKLGASSKGRWLQIPLNFLVVTFGWLLFRMGSLADVRLSLFTIFNGKFINFPFRGTALELEVYLGFLMILLVVAWEVYAEGHGKLDAFRGLPTWARWTAYTLLLLALSIYGTFGYTENPFVYFAF